MARVTASLASWDEVVVVVDIFGSRTTAWL